MAETKAEVTTTQDELGWYAEVMRLPREYIDYPHLLHVTGWYATEQQAKEAALRWAVANGVEIP